MFMFFVSLVLNGQATSPVQKQILVNVRMILHFSTFGMIDCAFSPLESQIFTRPLEKFTVADQPDPKLRYLPPERWD